MKHLLIILGVFFMSALAFVSCKKDKNNDPIYPAKIVTGDWSGGNGSTGYSCEVRFNAEDIPGGKSCTITLIDAQEDDFITYQGAYLYDASTGTVKVTLGQLDGGPESATLQFNPEGNALMVSFAATTEMGTYVVYMVTYPQSLFGAWVGMQGNQIMELTLFPKALKGGLPCWITMTLPQISSITYSGFYTYDEKTGKGTLIDIYHPSFPNKAPGTLTYNATAGTLHLKVADQNLEATLMRDVDKD